MGPNMFAVAVHPHRHNMSVHGIADTLDGVFGAGLCKAAVQHLGRGAML